MLQDLQPFSLQYPPSLSPRQRRMIYEGQVRAFLEASDIVEMEEEVLGDILGGFCGFDEASDDTAADENTSVQKMGRDATGNIELLLPYGFYVFFGPQGMATFCKVVQRRNPIRCANAGVLNHFLSCQSQWPHVGQNNKPMGCLLTSSSEGSPLLEGLNNAKSLIMPLQGYHSL